MAKRKKKIKIKITGKLLVTLVIVAVIALAAVYAHGYFFLHKTPHELTQYYLQLFADGRNTNNSFAGQSKVFDEETVKTVSDGDFSVHFLELGNKKTGDCIYIKAGENDILIDAGSDTSSVPAIKSYLNAYVTDKALEYVIVTHAHSDHIAGFAGSSNNPSLFREYDCKTIIDFPLTNSTSKMYANYIAERDAEVASGAKRYSALECYNGINGAQREYKLAESTTLTILYNYYYDHNTSDENDYSVCVLFKHDGRNYLFTGDLEADGEKHLVNNNDLPVCELYKAGHHGSKTSSSNALLSVIKPKIVCVCCCAGNSEYTSVKNNQFPTQDFIDRVALYTDSVYVTTMGDVSYLSGSDAERQYGSFNGTIVVLSDVGKETVLYFSNNSTKLKDQPWFKNMRTTPEAWNVSAHVGGI